MARSMSTTPAGTDLPASLIFAVNDVMVQHGLEVPAIQVARACIEMIAATPVAQGGQLIVEQPIPFLLAEIAP